ncbi:oxidoreductase [Pseudaminobacter arsenicus]|uniref:Oxidoreductase n=1 Tax=Borborobacter arsenicus TaxID=1851146 RepID=A0A432V4J4_9HYPH|nr:PDR/VanB family oxidoreductase [Pseudaminobacter arsenicus]RUM97030.1 oxidoreductase [Pseudaminobacter arsenicus]
MTTFDSRSLGQASELFELTIAELRPVAEGVVSLELRTPDGADLPAWQPGAHIDVLLPNGIVRQYSLCGDPAQRDNWRIGVLREPASRGGSSYVHEELRQGGTLSVAGPRNNFSLAEADRYLFIAGGIGITPILPMIRAVAAQGKPWTLLYGGRSRRSMAFLEEIGGLAGGEAHIVPQDEFGLLDLQKFLGEHLPDTLVYCCGPAPLIDAVEAKCQIWRSGALHLERFAPSDKAANKEKGSFEVELARSGKRLVIPPYRSILDILEENGCKVTNSCRAGICGTCLVKVLSGVPDHFDDVLSYEDQEAGDVMLVCVSRAKSDLLVLDL